MEEKENKPPFDLTKASEVTRYLSSIKEPYFDVKNPCQIGKFVAYYLDEYRGNETSKGEERALKFLKLVFSPNFENYIKIVNGKRFAPSFFQKIGKRRVDRFKNLLCKIDADKYGKFSYKSN